MTKYVTVLLDSYSKVVLNFSNLAASSHLFAHANNCSKVEKKTDQIFILPPPPPVPTLDSEVHIVNKWLGDYVNWNYTPFQVQEEH